MLAELCGLVMVSWGPVLVGNQGGFLEWTKVWVGSGVGGLRYGAGLGVGRAQDGVGSGVGWALVWVGLGPCGFGYRLGIMAVPGQQGLPHLLGRCQLVEVRWLRAPILYQSRMDPAGLI